MLCAWAIDKGKGSVTSNILAQSTASRRIASSCRRCLKTKILARQALVSINWTAPVQHPGIPPLPATRQKPPGKGPAHGIHLAQGVAPPILRCQERALTIMLSWVHFGDLHVTSDDGYESAAHLERLVSLVNEKVAHAVDFAYLPGDNANNGTPEQYARIRAALSDLHLPTNAIPGDHDFEPGSLSAFQAFHRELKTSALPRMIQVHGHRCLFLDVVSAGKGGPDFRLGRDQTEWLDEQMQAASGDPERPVVFMHAYPGDLAEGGEALARSFSNAHVAVVDTGHTHYNELLNDGSVIYAATRSTGQIEEDEGQAGFALVTVDGSIVSWRFQRLEDNWPMVVITAPADKRLVTDPRDPQQVPVYECVVRAKVFGAAVDGVANVVIASIDGHSAAMQPVTGERSVWQAVLPVPADVEGYTLTVTAAGSDGTKASDVVQVLTPLGASKRSLLDAPLGTDVHTIGEWREHGLLGSQLGPNKNGRAW